MKYSDFLASKILADRPSGMEPKDMPSFLFDWQKPIVRWALMRGRGLVAEDCGLGKTPQQLAWAHQVPGRVLVVAPLAVAQQTVREGRKFGIEVEYVRTQEQSDNSKCKIVITNYDMLGHFDPSKFDGVALDESSILKNYTGKFRNLLIDMFRNTKWRSCWTATPAPNDYMELGNHAEFLGAMTRAEMLATFFVHDGGRTSQWRLKGHATDAFWKWVSSWAVMLRKPSDIGFSDEGFNLPALNFNEHIIDSTKWSDGYLFPMPAESMSDERKVKRSSIIERCQAAADIAKKDQWLVWCELNDEGNELSRMIPGARQIKGDDTIYKKEVEIESFTEGETRVLVTKPKIAALGLNLQNCHNMIFSNISHSYEQFYQAVRRCWRYGQKEDVNVHIFLMDSEVAILTNIRRKEKEAQDMAARMIEHISESMSGELNATKKQSVPYAPKKKLVLPEFAKGN